MSHFPLKSSSLQLHADTYLGRVQTDLKSESTSATQILIELWQNDLVDIERLWKQLYRGQVPKNTNVLCTISDKSQQKLSKMTRVVHYKH